MKPALRFPHRAFAHPVTIAEIVAEARWLWTCARVLRANRVEDRAASLEVEARALIVAAREFKKGVAIVDAAERTVARRARSWNNAAGPDRIDGDRMTFAHRVAQREG